MIARRFVFVILGVVLFGGVGAAKDKNDEPEKIPTSITMRVGERRYYKGVNMAAIGDRKIASAQVWNQKLELKALKTGLTFLFVFPSGSNGNAKAMNAGAKNKITIHVTP